MTHTEPDCLFCKIVAGEIPSRKIYADEHAYAFLDVAPWQRGHTLVVPREHVDDLLTGPPQLAAIGPAIDVTSRLLVDRLGADGLNLMSSARAVAGQEVFHLHVHLIPRYADMPGLRPLFARRGAAKSDPADHVAGDGDGTPAQDVSSDLDDLQALITGAA